ncbi:TonB-dependent receptor domain-containing protein [Escherichia coli]
MAPNGRFWINVCCSPPLFRTDIENEVEQNDDGTYSQYGKKRVEGYEISVAGNITPAWQVIGGYTQQKKPSKRQRCCPGWFLSLPYTPEHAFTLWSRYQATDDISVGAGARYIGSMHKGSDGAVGTPAFTRRLLGRRCQTGVSS